MRFFTITLLSLVLLVAVGNTAVFAQSNEASSTATVEQAKPTPGSARIVSFRRPIPEYGYNGHQYQPHRINRDLVKAFGEFAPNRPKPKFNGAVIVALDRFSGNHTKATRKQRFRRFRKNNNFSGYSSSSYFVATRR
ncbi:MAG TPA: hypothetical protein DCE41_28055 [Cytophagales bacterium]|nr:hypothetical protein [Cytophagales bacterium]HAA18303.1 hypothetical protein [Cytophagales bacterium]HAP63878.1 hypothetical protein [Cytophagales bacterium]